MTSRDLWLEVASKLLSPARPRPEVERCLHEGKLHDEARRRVAQERTAAIADCVARIEKARAAVFARDDGSVPRLMTELEREWRTLSKRRTDPDGETMDLWARITPPSWHDRKRWRGNDRAVQMDVALALAADVGGVEAAEAAARTLRSALGAWGTDIGARIHWRAVAAASETDGVTASLAQALRTAEDALVGPRADAARARGEEARAVVHGAVRERFPARPLLAQGVAQAAFVDAVVDAARLADRPSPVTALRELWSTGYALVETSAAGVTLEVPLLPSP